jgi:hypothetical protein
MNWVKEAEDVLSTTLVQMEFLKDFEILGQHVKDCVCIGIQSGSLQH